MLIGLTGQIGAGKSTAARILESIGALVVDADEVGRHVVETSAPLRRKLAKAFGDDVLNATGGLDRQKVAERAFADEDSRRKLNELVHPYLLRELDKQVRSLSKRHEVVVIDAALLLEWELDRKVDYTIVIEAPEQVRFERLAARGVSPSDARARQQLQAPLSEFRTRADFVVPNDGDVNDLQRKLIAIWRVLTRRDRGDPHEETH